MRFGQRIWADINVEAAPVSSPAPSPVPAPAAAPSPAPAVVPAPVVEQPAPMAVDVAPADSTTPQEAASLRQLVDMGFKGDLLAALRRNKGDMMSTIRELLG